jgi:hypothetical protein
MSNTAAAPAYGTTHAVFGSPCAVAPSVRMRRLAPSIAPTTGAVRLQADTSARKPGLLVQDGVGVRSWSPPV